MRPDQIGGYAPVAIPEPEPADVLCVLVAEIGKKADKLADLLHDIGMRIEGPRPSCDSPARQNEPVQSFMSVSLDILNSLDRAEGYAVCIARQVGV